MPRKLYLLRHGQTDANAFGIIQGQSSNLPLNNIGIKQAELTAEALYKTNLNYVYVSPALRARQTAKKILENHNPMILSETHLNLAEINFGVLEGITFAEAEETYPNLLKIYRENPSQCVFTEGESMAEAYERIGQAINTILISHLKDESILIVSHGGAMSLIFLYLFNLDMDKMFHAVRHSNCGLSIIDLKTSIWNAPQSKPQIICLNDISHLKEEYVKRLENSL